MSETNTGGSAVMPDLALLAARVMVVAVFVVGAYWKATTVAGSVAYFTNLGLPLPTLAVYGTIALEFGLPLLVIAGYHARLAALVLAAFTLVATWLAHRYWEFPDAQQFGQAMNFWRNIGLVGGLLLIASFGPGRLALRR